MSCDVTCSPYQANSSVQTNLLQHPKVDWYKTHSIHAYSLLTHLTCVKLFKDFQSLSHIAHCNWNSGVSHAICHWNSHEALPFHPVIAKFSTERPHPLCRLAAGTHQLQNAVLGIHPPGESALATRDKEDTEWCERGVRVTLYT